MVEDYTQEDKSEYWNKKKGHIGKSAAVQSKSKAKGAKNTYRNSADEFARGGKTKGGGNRRSAKPRSGKKAQDYPAKYNFLSS